MSKFTLFFALLLSMIMALRIKQSPFLTSNFGLDNDDDDSSSSFESPSIHFCSGQDDVFHPTHLSLSPDPPVRGEQLNIVLNGTLSAPVIQGSTAHVMVKLGFIKLLDRDYDVCEKAGEIDKECPVEKGPLDIVKVVDIPSQVPPGRYRIHVDAYLPNGKKITCIDADFRM